MAKNKRRSAQAKAQEPLPPIAAYEHGERVRDAQESLNIITAEMSAKGTYDVAGRRIVNRGGTPVMRWTAARKLSETQGLAIAHCYRLWDLVGIKQVTTAAYGERIAGAPPAAEHRTQVVLDAQKDLDRIKDYIPRTYFSIFENVCRFDEPAGAAGSRLGFGSRSSEDRAHTVVCFVADVIAMKEGLVPVTNQIRSC